MSNNTSNQQKKQTKKRTKDFRDVDHHRRGRTHVFQTPPAKQVEPGKIRWIGQKVLTFELSFHKACIQVKANELTVAKVRQDLIVFITAKPGLFSDAQISLLAIELNHNFS